MIEQMLQRWNELGKPLFMIPRDFRERILTGMHKQVGLSYLKWLTMGVEIDMFEILCMLIIFSRCEMVKRLESKWPLFTIRIK
jgi:hypothetical protein